MLPTGNLYIFSRSQMCTFDVTEQMIKIKKRKEFTCEKESKCLFFSLENEPFRLF